MDFDSKPVRHEKQIDWNRGLDESQTRFDPAVLVDEAPAKPHFTEGKWNSFAKHDGYFVMNPVKTMKQTEYSENSRVPGTGHRLTSNQGVEGYFIGRLKF